MLLFFIQSHRTAEAKNTEEDSDARSFHHSQRSLRILRRHRDLPGSRTLEEIRLHAGLCSELEPADLVAVQGAAAGTQARHAQHCIARAQAFRGPGGVRVTDPTAQFYQLRLLRFRSLGSAERGRNLHIYGKGVVRVPVLREQEPPRQPNHYLVDRRRSTPHPGRDVPATLVATTSLLRLTPPAGSSPGLHVRRRRPCCLKRVIAFSIIPSILNNNHINI